MAVDVDVDPEPTDPNLHSWPPIDGSDMSILRWRITMQERFQAMYLRTLNMDAKMDRVLDNQESRYSRWAMACEVAYRIADRFLVFVEKLGESGGLKYVIIGLVAGCAIAAGATMSYTDTGFIIGGDSKEEARP